MSITLPKSHDSGRIIQWKCADTVVPLTPLRPLIMGILNVTPDSFSDGGAHNTADAAIAHARQMMADGADIIDIGGESTRPGADPVSAGEEKQRVVPVVKTLAEEGAVISIDTMKAEVAEAALSAGAKIINDVSACTCDADMVKVAADFGSGVVLMHMQGKPRTMQEAPSYENVVNDVADYLQRRAEAVIDAGAARESVVLDPGIGFGKTIEHNLSLLARIDSLSEAGYPVLIGISRKSFIGRITGRNVNERLAGSIAGLVWCMLKGVHIVRVHDVARTLDAIKIIEALKKA